MEGVKIMTRLSASLCEFPLDSQFLLNPTREKKRKRGSEQIRNVVYCCLWDAYCNEADQVSKHAAGCTGQAVVYAK